MKTGVSDPLCQAAFWRRRSKTGACRLPWAPGAGGGGTARLRPFQRPWNYSRIFSMTADNSIFPLSSSRTSLFLRTSSFKAKMFIFLPRPCPPWHEVKRGKIVITQQRGMACRGHWGHLENPMSTALGPPHTSFSKSHIYAEKVRSS